MDPSRKRKVRLVVALTAALLLAGSLLFVSFSSASPDQTPSQVLASGSGGQARLGGKVVTGSIKHEGATLVFQVRDPNGTKALPVTYRGNVPDPFREGREVQVTGTLKNGVFEGERNSLVTKCPSKFQNDASGKTS
jgi:cytochrome c-type biogenesis protein CcmE